MSSDDYSLERNSTEGFARRVRTNLEFIIESRSSGKDVHQVTQLTISLLGLIVFPWEANALSQMEKWKLADLENQGWPRWTILQDRNAETSTLGKLTWHLRNAAAHRRVRFFSDGSELEQVEIQFEDALPRKEVDWRAKIRASDLKDFCDRFTESLENLVG